MTSKTVDGETTTFSYDSDVWDDQLTAVNGEPLTYDINGNLASYGGKEYTWSQGKRLESITDGENTYTYYYDENGIRWKKIVNNQDIRINTIGGRVVAQRVGLSPMYFQYDRNGTPFGFIYGGEQYFYITNLSGDVVGIADSEGNKIASYTYDEWGKLLEISGNTSIAELNPLRYRGYYYDSETGYYYLQSRYYDPELGRFISADDFEYIDTSNRFSSNAYIYCWNCPTAFEDAEGTTPKLATDKQSILDFISNITAPIKNGIVTSFEKLQSQCSASIEKLKFYYLNPGELTSELLSNLLGKEVHIEFKLLKAIRSQIVSAFQTIKNGINNIGSKDSNQDEGIALQYNIADSEKTDNLLVAILKSLTIAIPANALFLEFEAIMKTINASFDIDAWFNNLTEKFQNFVIDVCTYFSTLIHTAWKEGKEYLEEFALLFSFDKIIEWLIDSAGFSFNVSNLISFTSAFKDRDEGKYTTGQAWISFITNAILTTISIFVPMEVGGKIGMDLVSFITNFVLDGSFNFQNGHLWGF